jgi:hypothetical protein
VWHERERKVNVKERHMHIAERNACVAQINKGPENGKIATRPRVATARTTRTSLRMMMGKWTRTTKIQSAVNNSHGRSVKTMDIVATMLAA